MREYEFKIIDEDLSLKLYIYQQRALKSMGVILYFHGGGFIYGDKDDLPKLHIETLTKAGYSIISFDYRLAPEASFDLILEDVLDAINYFILNKENLGFSNLPYFLWGRSAGAYLGLLAATYDLKPMPRGIISYYGYGFNLGSWYERSSIDYLKYPLVSKDKVNNLIRDYFISSASIQERFPLYLYGRQTGKWLDMVFGKSIDKFKSQYILGEDRIKSDFPPTFIAHNFKDIDVPFGEAIELSKLITNSSLFTCSTQDHDFDRHENSTHTINLLNGTLEFLKDLLK